jgi:anaerobic selenocysteine-containing dehydrogenase
MIRRDFFKALGAFTAAIAAGARMPSGLEAKAALPAPVPPPVAAAPIAKAVSAQDQVMSMLVDCDVIGIEQMHVGVDGFVRVKIIYQMDKVRGRLDTHFNAEAKALVEGKRPIEIVVHATSRNVDICTLGDYGENFAVPVADPVYEIEVTWA